MSGPLPSLESHTLTVRRFREGTWVDGKYEPGPLDTLTFSASVQPLRPNELLQLPEARRTRQAMKVYTSEALQTANEQLNLQSDEVDILGLTFEVHSVEKWTLPSSSIEHFKSVIVRKTDLGGVV